MNRRLCVGLIEKSAAWEQLLNQIGCDYEAVDFSKKLLPSYSCIIANETVNDRQLLLLQSYIEEGGAVVDVMGRNLFPHCDISSIYHQFILNDDPVYGVPYIDFYENLGQLKNAGSWYHTLHIDPMDEGYRVFLGWPIAKLYSDEEYIRKKFRDPHGVFPDEIVNRKSRHYLRRAIQDLLIQLHDLAGLPFVSRVNAPKINKAVFLFRIDTDYSDAATIRRLYGLAKKYDLKLTWFLHVEAHRKAMSVFSEMVNQEIALHGYEHAFSPSFEKNTNNILSATRVLDQEKLDYRGFCAPYGIWSAGLGEAIDQAGLEYSSEFTLSYDDLPFQPLKNGKTYQHLQIPIHPVCTGSFSRKQANDQQIVDYFESVIRQKMTLGEPVILYHHPMQGKWDVIESIFRKVRDEGLISMTFSEFIDFWKQRNQSTLIANFDGTQLTVESESINLILHRPDYKAEVQLMKSAGIKLSELEWKAREKTALLKREDFKKLKTASLKEIKWSLQDRFRRHRL